MSVLVGAVVVGAVVGVAGAVTSYNAAEEQSAAIDQSLSQQYAYDMEKYKIEQSYRREQLSYSRDLDKYGDKQMAFALEQRAYGEEVYDTALGNAKAEQEFRDTEVFNKKMAATVEYNAQADVANVMMQGAVDSLESAIGETLRTGSSKVRELDRQATKAAGSVVAKTKAGITGGASRDRELINVHMERNRAKALLEDEAKTNIIQATNSKNQMVNDYSLKVNESYRNLTAMLELEPQPVAAIQGPAPVFAEKAPIGPVTPIGPEPMEGVNTSGGDWASLSAGLSGASAGFSFGTSIYGAF